MVMSCCGAGKGSLKTVATADVNAVFVVFEVSVVGGDTQIKCFCFGHLNAVSFFLCLRNLEHLLECFFSLSRYIV